MAQIPSLPITMLASIRSGSTSVNTTYNNPSSIYDGYPYTFDCKFDITPLSNSQPPNYQYNAYDIVPGMWILQQTGLCYEIVSINTIYSSTEADVTIKDVDLYNLLADYTFTGNNYPQENANGVIFPLSDDGDPILSELQLQSSNLPNINYWVNDAYARFQYRNLIQFYYTNNPNSLVYSNYSVGQTVYIG